MTHDRFYESFGIAAAAQDVRAGERMLIGRRKHFVIEVMQHADESPFIDVRIRPAVALSTRAHRGFDGQRVFAQAVTFGVFAKQLPGFVTSRHDDSSERKSDGEKTNTAGRE